MLPIHTKKMQNDPMEANNDVGLCIFQNINAFLSFFGWSNYRFFISFYRWQHLCTLKRKAACGRGWNFQSECGRGWTFLGGAWRHAPPSRRPQPLVLDAMGACSPGSSHRPADHKHPAKDNSGAYLFCECNVVTKNVTLNAHFKGNIIFAVNNYNQIQIKAASFI